MSSPTPSLNGVTHDPHAPLPEETCLQYVLRRRPDGNPAHWRLTLHSCHVPAEAPAVEWVDGLQRVSCAEPHLLQKETR